MGRVARIAALLTLTLLPLAAPGSQGLASARSGPSLSAIRGRLGYLPGNYRGYLKVKALADRLAGVHDRAGSIGDAAAPVAAPVSGPGWTGVNSTNTAPLDANGAVGPTR